MDQRKMMLPDGWYPHSHGSAEKQLKRWKTVETDYNKAASAGIAPHAGWDFSGQIAWNIINSIPRDCDLIIIAGGHLSAAAEFRVLEYRSIETPFGALKVDNNLQSLLCRGFKSDRDPDNTVEIMLPMIKYRFPDISILPVRMPASEQSIEWGRRVAQVCAEQGLKAFFLGSTDLSHYGSRFSYSDYGSGEKARTIIREKDHKYLKLLADLKAEESIVYARDEKTACSSGAAAATLGFILETGQSEGKICEHKYSYEIFDSGADFVGYGSVLFQ
jgi:MEMO1 family protein